MGEDIYTWTLSNPVPLSIKDPIVINSQTVSGSCGECSGEMTITGSGFGEAPPAGAELYINVMQNSIPLTIVEWTDTQITVTGAACDGSEVTVNALLGSATK